MRFSKATLAPCLLLVAAPARPDPLSLVSPFDSTWTAATHIPSPHPAYVYVWPQSVIPGDTISIYVSSLSSTVGIRFQRVDSVDVYVADTVGARHPTYRPNIPAGVQLVPLGGGTNEGVWTTGCGWHPTYRLAVPSNWSSAPYYVEITPEDAGPDSLRLRQYATFVVRNPWPQNSANGGLVILSTSTWWAYEDWGGRSLYDSQHSDRTNIASMLRPSYVELGHGPFFSFDSWVPLFARNGLPFDYATMEDLQVQGQALLRNYGEVVFVGHSEYWSNEQRNAVEGYIAAGGNVFFATGNISWWRIEYSPDMKQIICFKGDNVNDLDGGTRGIAPGQQYRFAVLGPHPLHPSTFNWRSPPANRGSHSMTGVEYQDGGHGSTNIDGLGTHCDWTVRDPTHWAFAGTGLAQGAKLGSQNAAGDEIDGVLLNWEGDPSAPDATPFVSTDAYSRGTPASFHVLATCEADPLGRTYLQSPHWAVMGWYQQPGQGLVFTFPEVRLGYDVYNPQTGGNAVMQQIVLNVARYLLPPPTVSVKSGGSAPLRAVAYPNPLVDRAGSRACVSVFLQRTSPCKFEVVSAGGEAIYERRERLPAGPSTLVWTLRQHFTPGVYMWRLRTWEGVASGKFVLL